MEVESFLMDALVDAGSHERGSLFQMRDGIHSLVGRLLVVRFLCPQVLHCMALVSCRRPSLAGCAHSDVCPFLEALAGFARNRHLFSDLRHGFSRVPSLSADRVRFERIAANGARRPS